MERKAYEITYKNSPKSRKVFTATQFHATAEDAAQLVLIRDHNPEAVCLGVREVADPRS